MSGKTHGKVEIIMAVAISIIYTKQSMLLEINTNLIPPLMIPFSYFGSLVSDIDIKQSTINEMLNNQIKNIRKWLILFIGLLLIFPKKKTTH